MGLTITDFKTGILDLVTDLVTAEKMSLANAITEGSQRISKFEDSQSHTFLEGIRHGNLIPILNDTPNANAFPFIDETVCATPDCDVTISGRTHKWELGMIGCKPSICLNSFDNNFMAWWGVNKKLFGEDDVNSILVNYIRDLFLRDFNLAKWRVAYFSDKASLSTALNGIDGFFTQMEANPAQVITITQNAGVNYAAQMNITGLDIYNYLVSMDELMTSQYWNAGALEYRMTKVTAMKLANYLNGLKDKSCCDGVERLNPDALMVGTTSFNYMSMAFRGIPIRVIEEWDYLINNHLDLNGGGANNARVNPHRIVLTYKENLIVGIPDMGHLENFDIWYSKDDEKIYMRGRAYLGAGVPLEDYVLAI